MAYRNSAVSKTLISVITLSMEEIVETLNIFCALYQPLVDIRRNRKAQKLSESTCGNETPAIPCDLSFLLLTGQVNYY